MSTFGSGHDNFISIRVVEFQTFPFIFTSPMDIGCIFLIVYHVYESEHLSPFVDKMNIPPRRERDRPRRAFVDKKAVLAPPASPLQEEPQV